MWQVTFTLGGGIALVLPFRLSVGTGKEYVEVLLDHLVYGYHVLVKHWAPAFDTCKARPFDTCKARRSNDL